MKVVLVNGSPKGQTSNTMHLADAVLEGMKKVTDVSLDIITLADLEIQPCQGCLGCWGKHPGKCKIQDKMQELYPLLLEADIILESFPLYFFGMPGPMKTFTDRLVCLFRTYMGKVWELGDGPFNVPRYDFSKKKIVFVSTCGYGRTEEIFEPLLREYDLMFGRGNYIPLLCPQGEMFAISQLATQIETYLDRYRAVGEALGTKDCVPEELLLRCREPLLPQRMFELLISNYWKGQQPGGE